MKRLFVTILCVFLIAAVSGCGIKGGSAEPSTNEISVPQLTDREKLFLSLGSSHSFVFDFRVDRKYQWAEVWVETYEFGKKTAAGGKLSTGLLEGSEAMILVKASETTNQRTDWTLAIQGGGATASSKSTHERKSSDSVSYAKTWGTNPLMPMAITGDEIILANVSYKDQSRDSTLSPLNGSFYEDPEGNLSEILEYDLVHLIKCRFYEKSPF